MYIGLFTSTFLNAESSLGLNYNYLFQQIHGKLSFPLSILHIQIILWGDKSKKLVCLRYFLNLVKNSIIDE